MLTRLFYEEDDMMHLKQMPAQDKYNLKSRIKYKHKFHALATYSLEDFAYDSKL